MINWRTTLLAVAGAIWLGIQPLITNGDFNLERDWKQLLTAAGLAIFGFFVKDAKVAGVGPTAITEKEVKDRIEAREAESNELPK